MSKEKKIIEGLRNLKPEKAVIVPGIVKSVNKDEQTASVEIDKNFEIEDIRLKSLIDENTDNFFIAFPKKESSVLVAFIDCSDVDGFIIQCSEIESIGLKISDTKITADKDKICLSSDEMLFNSDKNGGLIKIEELKTQIDKNSDLLKAIQNAFTGQTPAPNDGGGLLKTASSSFSSMQTADLSNIENEKIKHQ